MRGEVEQGGILREGEEGVGLVVRVARGNLDAGLHGACGKGAEFGRGLGELAQSGGDDLVDDRRLGVAEILPREKAIPVAPSGVGRGGSERGGRACGGPRLGVPHE